MLREARDAGVVGMLLCAVDLADAARAAALVARWPAQLICSAGVHPHHAAAAPADLQARLRPLLGAPGVRAVGETGLDFDRLASPRVDQERVLEQQLELAVELGLPVLLHDRDSGGETARRVARHRAGLGPIVAHCFTGDAAALDAWLALDAHIGITGWICDERRGRQLRALVHRIPADRLLLETDSPYLFPRTHRPRRRGNTPALLPWVAAEVAVRRGEAVAKVAEQCTLNALRCFGAPAVPGESLPDGHD